MKKKATTYLTHKEVEMEIDLRQTNHTFDKHNLVTLMGKRGAYDLYKCDACGLIGKRYGASGILVIANNVSRKKVFNCPKSKSIRKIKITTCNAVGSVFKNLKPGSVHDVIDPPEGKDNSRGVWVMGVGEPVKVLFGEFVEA